MGKARRERAVVPASRHELPGIAGPERLNFHHLFYFHAVAKEGTIARAAAALRVSQPTISQQIHALEDALGEKLFVRSGRTLQLTDVGRVVVDHASTIFEVGRELVDAVRGRVSGKNARCESAFPTRSLS